MSTADEIRLKMRAAELTVQTLQAALSAMFDNMTLTSQPSYMIVHPKVYRAIKRLVPRHSLRRARGARGRKRALDRRYA